MVYLISFHEYVDWSIQALNAHQQKRMTQTIRNERGEIYRNYSPYHLVEQTEQVVKIFRHQPGYRPCIKHYYEFSPLASFVRDTCGTSRDFLSLFTYMPFGDKSYLEPRLLLETCSGHILSISYTYAVEKETSYYYPIAHLIDLTSDKSQICKINDIRLDEYVVACQIRKAIEHFLQEQSPLRLLGKNGTVIIRDNNRFFRE